MISKQAAIATLGETTSQLGFALAVVIQLQTTWAPEQIHALSTSLKALEKIREAHTAIAAPPAPQNRSAILGRIIGLGPPKVWPGRWRCAPP